MNKKKYPTTDKEWAKYLTVQNYYTLNEIEYRKSLIIESNCDFDKVFNGSVDNKYRKCYNKK